jgi:tRNA nucleotidyltransferase (CCA-adding enzyme)
MIKKTQIPSEVRKLGKIFADAGHEMRPVGGWVRDSLRGIDPKDLDLATTATPGEMLQLCMEHDLSYIPTGIDHGTVTIVMHGKKSTHKSGLHPTMVPAFEVTTLRVDRETDGRHAQVEFTTDWQKDAERRDFTINAMSVGLDGQLFDYFGGQQHLTDRRVVFVGDAHARINEDFLRILRYFRFRSRMTDRYFDREVLSTIKSNAHGLQQISVERIWMEMSKILSGDPTMLCLCLIDMLETGVLAQIGLAGVERYDIVHATIVRDQTTNPITVLAALTDTPLGEAWKMSTPEKALLAFLQAHRRIPRPDIAFIKEIAYDHSPAYAVECASLFGKTEALAAARQWTPPAFPVGGEDLIALGHCPGKEMGVTLRRLTRAWKDSDYRLDKAELLSLV